MLQLLLDNAATKRIMSARKLLRKDFKLRTLLTSFLIYVLLKVLYLLFVSKLIYKIFQHVFGAFNKLALISNGSNDIAKICSWVVQFLKIGTPKDQVRLSKKLTKAKFTVKYITKSVSEFPHAATNSKRKFLSASTSHLHKILLFNNTYGWIGYTYQNVIII